MKPNKLQFSKKIKLTPDLLILYEISQVNSIPTSIHFGVIFRRPGGNRQLVANIIILQAWSFAWWRDWHNWNPSWMQLSSHFGTNAFECSEFYFLFKFKSTTEVIGRYVDLGDDWKCMCIGRVRSKWMANVELSIFILRPSHRCTIGVRSTCSNIDRKIYQHVSKYGYFLLWNLLDSWVVWLYLARGTELRYVLAAVKYCARK